MKKNTPDKKLLFSLIIFFLFFGYQVLAQTASFYLSSSKGSYRVGESFSVDVLVEVEGISINAAQATLYFPTDKLKVLGVSKKNSIFTLWVQEPSFSNQKGTITFLGGLPSPGYYGQNGKIISISFQAKKEGEARVFFTDGKILANDPLGTDIFLAGREGNFTILPGEPIQPGEKPSLPEVEIIDEDAPEPFEMLSVDNEGDPTNPSPLLYFETTDKISGISHYEVEIGNETFQVKVGENLPWRLPKKEPGDYQVFIRAFDKAGNFTEGKIGFKIESITVPKIANCPENFRAGEEILYISGSTLAKSTVILSLEKNGNIIKTWEVLSDENGEFSLAREDLFPSGNYKIVAKTQDSRGAKSYNSEPCLVRIILGGIALGPLVLTYKKITLIIFLIFVILLIILFLILSKIKKTKRKIKEEALDLKKKFYKEYNELVADIKTQLEFFRTAKEERELTEEEKRMEYQLLRDLADVERVLREELADIEEMK